MPVLPDPPRPFWQRFAGRRRLSVKELGDRFDAIARDSRIKGVVLHLRPVAIPMATLQDLRELVGKLRKAGKRVVSWAPFYTTGSYYLACACDEILLMPTGSIQPLGFASTGMFLADGLARFGIGADFVQVSPYKSAADPLTRSRMSNEFREQVTWLLESQHKELIKAIEDARQLDEAGARELIDGSPYGHDVAVESRAVDRVLAEEDLPSHLGREGGGAAVIGTWERAASRMRTSPPRFRMGRFVALMRIEGTIIDGRSGRLPVRPPIDVALTSDERAFSEEERRIIRGDIERVYRVFIEIVAAARKLAPDDLQPMAQGKVWTGRQALERKLVDELGGLDAGVAKARALAGLAEDAPLREVHGPK